MILAEVKLWANYMLYVVVCVCVCVCVVCVCVCRGGMRLLFLGCKGACSFLVKQMWTVPHKLTPGEVVLTTYMLVVLFLERSVLLSVPRPRTSPSSCTVLASYGRGICTEKART